MKQVKEIGSEFIPNSPYVHEDI